MFVVESSLGCTKLQVAFMLIVCLKCNNGRKLFGELTFESYCHVNQIDFLHLPLFYKYWANHFKQAASFSLKKV